MPHALAKVACVITHNFGTLYCTALFVKITVCCFHLQGRSNFPTLKIKSADPRHVAQHGVTSHKTVTFILNAVENLKSRRHYRFQDTHSHDRHVNICDVSELENTKVAPSGIFLRQFDSATYQGTGGRTDTCSSLTGFQRNFFGMPEWG